MTAFKIALKRSLARFSFTPNRDARRIVLLYHSVGDTPWAMNEALFRRQMEWLAEAGEVVSLSGLLQTPHRSEAPRVAITFDDGYAAVGDVAYPIMKKLGMTGAVFVNTGWLGEGERKPSVERLGHYPGEHFLSWQDIKNLDDGGWTIGSHGVDHLDFTREPEAKVSEQLHVSKRVIETRLSKPCEGFAYTWGRHSPHLRSLVAKAGYGYALGGWHAPVKEGCDIMAIPRLHVAKDYSLDDFKAIVRGDWDYIGWIQKLRRRPA